VPSADLRAKKKGFGVVFSEYPQTLGPFGEIQPKIMVE
jgi:hypothetical protein